jgi:hypothetical protein
MAHGLSFLVCGLPTTAIFFSAATPVVGIWRGVVWTISADLMSAAYFTNAGAADASTASSLGLFSP